MSEIQQAALCDRQQAAQYLNISVVTLDRKVRQAEIAHTRIGRRILFKRASLDQFIEQNTRAVRVPGRNSKSRNFDAA